MSKPSRGAARGRSCWVRPGASGTAGPCTTRGGSLGGLGLARRQAQGIFGRLSLSWDQSPQSPAHLEEKSMCKAPRPQRPRVAGHLEGKSMYGSGCKGSSRIPTDSSRSQRCWHLLPLRAAREERDMRHRTGTTEITLTAALAKLWLPQPCSFLPAGNSGAEPAASPKAALQAWKRAANAVPARQLWGSGNFDSMCRGVSRPYGSGAGGCGRGAKGYQHAGPHSCPGMLLAATSQARGSPDGHPDLQRAPEALCQPCTRVPISGPDSHPCASWAPCPAVPVPPGVPSDPPGTLISVFPRTPPSPRAACAGVGPRGAPGGAGQDPPRSALSRPVPPAPSRPRSAPPCPGTARHGTAAPR